MVVLCTLVVVYGLPASLNQTEQENETENQKPSRLCEIDFCGLFTFSTTILSLLFVLQTLGMREEDQLVPTWSLALGFVISAMVFIFTEVYFAKKPLVPMNLLLQDLGGYCMVQWLLFAGRTAVCIHDSPMLKSAMLTFIGSLSATLSLTLPVSKSIATFLLR